MPKPNRHEMSIRKDVSALCLVAREKLGTAEADNEKKTVFGFSMVDTFLRDLFELHRLDEKTFGANGEREPKPEELTEYVKKCTSCLTQLKEIKNYSSNELITDQRVIAACKYISDNYADRIMLELKPYLKTKKQGVHWNKTVEKKEIENFIETCRKEISDKIDERTTDKNEVADAKKTSWLDGSDKLYLPMGIMLTGDAEELARYYFEHEDVLKTNHIATKYLKGRIGTLVYYNELEKISKNKDGMPIFEVENKGKNISLKEYEGKYQYQTTINGCWSAAYAMLLESRGVSLNQEIIRSFRPDVGFNDVYDVSERAACGVIKDGVFGALELGDLTLKLLPSTALRQVGISGYEKKNQKDVIKGMKDFIKEALLKYKSPVILNNNSHCITVVGIEGDNLKILNSNGDKPGLQEKINLKDYVSKNNNVSLTWMQNLTFDKDGRCTDMPAEFGNIHYENGKLVDIGNNDDLNKAGQTFRVTKPVGKIIFDDSIYCPDEVPKHVFGEKVEVKKTKTVGTEASLLPGFIDDKIKGAYDKIVNVIERWDYYRNPTEELRYSIATMIAYKAVSRLPENEPQNKQKYVDILESDFNSINKITSSQGFKNFYKNLKEEDVIRLYRPASGKVDEAIDEFCDKCLNLIKNSEKEVASVDKAVEQKPDIGPIMK